MWRFFRQCQYWMPPRLVHLELDCGPTCGARSRRREIEPTLLCRAHGLGDRQQSASAGKNQSNPDMLVHHFLEQSAAEWPEKVALVCGGQRLTYLEINLMANRLANGLREQGIRRGDRVGIYLGNTVETVIGVFAVLKAGGVFVIINPTTKLEKLLVILNN